MGTSQSQVMEMLILMIIEIFYSDVVSHYDILVLNGILDLTFDSLI